MRATARARSSSPDVRQDAPLALAFELFELAEAMLRQRLRRDHPGISEEEIERRVDEWLSERPGAEIGDAPGVIGTWPRRR